MRNGATGKSAKRIRKAITPMSRAIHTSNMLLRGRYTPSREQMTMMLSRIAVGNLMSFPEAAHGDDGGGDDQKVGENQGQEGRIDDVGIVRHEPYAGVIPCRGQGWRA